VAKAGLAVLTRLPAPPEPCYITKSINNTLLDGQIVEVDGT
jgi:hypothetical protein